jgi:hypothetical protein
MPPGRRGSNGQDHRTTGLQDYRTTRPRLPDSVDPTNARDGRAPLKSNRAVHVTCGKRNRIHPCFLVSPKNFVTAL